jgi:hypothetical protein
MKPKLKHRQIDRGSKVGVSEAESRIDYDKEKPTFCLRFIDPQYCISKCDKDEKAAFVDKIYRMSQMTWLQLRMADRHGMGSEKLPRDSIKRPIPAGISEEVSILAFRFSGLKSMVGYRQDGLFHIIWLDRDFTLYDH